MEFARSRGGDAGALPLIDAAVQLLDAARQLELLDADLAREAYLEALAAAMYAGRLGEPDGMKEVAQTAQITVLAKLPQPRRPVDLLLSGVVARIIGGAPAGADLLHTALEQICDQPLSWMPLGLAIVHRIGSRRTLSGRRGMATARDRYGSSRT